MDDFSISQSENTLPSTTSTTKIIFIIGQKGKGKLMIDTQEYTVSSSTLVTVLPYHILASKDCSPDFCYKVVSFSFDFIADYPFLLKSYLCEEMNHHPIIKLKKQELATLNAVHNLMYKQYQRTSHPSRIEIAKALLFTFIAEVSYIYIQQRASISPTLQEHTVDRFFKLLHANYKRERTSSFYAEQMNINSSSLTKTIKKITGHSLYFWISDFTIQESKRLLTGTNKTVMEISEELNFPNSSFFARFFKRNTNKSPIQFREKIE